MFRSLRGRLTIVLVLLTAAAVAAGFVMFALYQQSRTAQIAQTAATTAQACDAIGRTYRFYAAGWHPDATPDPTTLRQDLAAVVVTALRTRPGLEGGLWQGSRGSLAYAFPTYEGSGPKTDLPEAERPAIQAINQAALADDRAEVTQTDAGSQTLLMAACPLSGPLPGLTGWAMTRVHTLGTEAYRQLGAGIAILALAVAGASLMIATIVLPWSRHVAAIERALGEHDIADLPVLPPTGERELDRIIRSLNDAGQRLGVSRDRNADLAVRVAAGERLAAIGRVAAGVAHEIRNPLATMRLRAETARNGPIERKDQALAVVLDQVERLDDLVRRLLGASERDPPQPARVAMDAFLAACADDHRDVAFRRGVGIEAATTIESACFDPAQMRRALGNLVANAIQATAAGIVRVAAAREGDDLVLSVRNPGAPPPAPSRGELFDPFVTGRPDGTGLGLSIVREIAQAHGGTAGFQAADGVTTFRIVIPWRPC